MTTAAPTRAFTPMWGAAEGRCLGALQTKLEDPLALAVAGMKLAVGGKDGWIQLWDLEGGVMLRGGIGKHADDVGCVAWSPDGALLASAANDGCGGLWDARTGRDLAPLEGHGGSVRSLAWSPDGRRLATGCSDRSVRLWDPGSSQELARLTGPAGAVRSVAWSPDGRVLAAGAEDKTVTLWDPDSGQELARLKGHEKWVTSVAWSPDGGVLATGSYDKTVRLWDPRRQQELTRLGGDPGFVQCIAWSPDGRFLATASSAGELRWWDPQSGQPLAAVDVPEKAITSMAVSADGGFVVVGCRFGVVRAFASGDLGARPTPAPPDPPAPAHEGSAQGDTRERAALPGEAADPPRAPRSAWVLRLRDGPGGAPGDLYLVAADRAAIDAALAEHARANTGRLLLHEQSIELSVYDGDDRVAQIDLRPLLRVNLPGVGVLRVEGPEAPIPHDALCAWLDARDGVIREAELSLDWAGVDLPALRHPPMAAGDERTLDIGGRQTLAPLGWLDLG